MDLLMADFPGLCLGPFPPLQQELLWASGARHAPSCLQLLHLLLPTPPPPKATLPRPLDGLAPSQLSDLSLMSPPRGPTQNPCLK